MFLLVNCVRRMSCKSGRESTKESIDEQSERRKRSRNPERVSDFPSRGHQERCALRAVSKDVRRESRSGRSRAAGAPRRGYCGVRRGSERCALRAVSQGRGIRCSSVGVVRERPAAMPYPPMSLRISSSIARLPSLISLRAVHEPLLPRNRSSWPCCGGVMFYRAVGHPTALISERPRIFSGAGIRAGA
jgi:hypothetical protein